MYDDDQVWTFVLTNCYWFDVTPHEISVECDHEDRKKEKITVRNRLRPDLSTHEIDVHCYLDKWNVIDTQQTNRRRTQIIIVVLVLGDRKYYNR